MRSGIMETTKKESSLRQILTAIRLFHNGDYDCAITLAAAAEGMLPDTDEPHIFGQLKGHPKFPELQINLMINWLKHSNSPETSADKATIDEFEVTIVVARAITRFVAVYSQSHQIIEDFMKWGYEIGHLPKYQQRRS